MEPLKYSFLKRNYTPVKVTSIQMQLAYGLFRLMVNLTNCKSDTFDCTSLYHCSCASENWVAIIKGRDQRGRYLEI